MKAYTDEQVQQIEDALMLEHCPDEMTQQQVNDWANHQVAAGAAPKCVCGQFSLGVVHRSDGPCYVPTEPHVAVAAAGAAPHKPLKIEFTKEWCAAAAKLEEGQEVGIGAAPATQEQNTANLGVGQNLPIAYEHVFADGRILSYSPTEAGFPAKKSALSVRPLYMSAAEAQTVAQPTESAFNQELAWRLDLQAKNQMLLEALNDIAYGLEGARIWGGMDWTYNPLHPFKYLPLRDKARAAIAAAAEQEGPAK